MRAVVFEEHGGPEVLKVVELPSPEPGPGEVRVRVEAVALNHLDLWVRGGLPGQELSMPHLLGSEVAGIVEEVGGGEPSLAGLYGDPIAVGQRVVLAPMISCRECEFCQKGYDGLCVEGFKIFGFQLQGGYAEEMAVPADVCIPLEPDDDPITWAALPLTFMTAYHMLFAQAGLHSGETVLVHAAGSGMGVAGIQSAREAGATVYTTASTQEKLDKGIELGAAAGINYEEQDFSEAIRELTDGRGVDVIFSHIGAATFDKNLLSLARGGRLVTCGATTGADVNLNLRHLFVKQLRIIGSYMGSRQELREVIDGARAGHYVPVVDRTFPLEEAAEAHRRLADRKQFGKLVLLP
jgi:NADPH:quinone reductase-like Zn-dependent oxidoreductase